MGQINNKALVIRNLHKTYPSGFQALKGIDLEVEEGDFFALLGPNGAGKTTTIGILTSLINKTEGEIEVFGHRLSQDPITPKSLIGVVPQEFNFNFFERVIDVVINQAGYYGVGRNQAYERAEHYLTQLGLWEKRNDAARQLSGGMKRRLMIVRALVHHPKMLILDEPTAGVDIELRRSMWIFLQEINRQGTTLILTTHYLEEAESLCRGIAILDKGRVVENTTVKQLLAGLNTETLILDVLAPLSNPPFIEGCTVVLKDAQSLEITFPKTLSLNSIFEALSHQRIQITSLRNKSNRLEQLFLNLVEKK